MSETQAPPKVTREMIEAAREAGASAYYRVIAAANPHPLGVEHNYVGEELVRCFDDPAEPTAEEVDRMAKRSGDYVWSLFKGDIAEALYHADATNMRILLRLFDADLLREHLVDDRGSVESADRWLEPNLERYGWPGYDDE
jgi:hypothetical protein